MVSDAVKCNRQVMAHLSFATRSVEDLHARYFLQGRVLENNFEVQPAVYELSCAAREFMRSGVNYSERVQTLEEAKHDRYIGIPPLSLFIGVLKEVHTSRPSELHPYSYLADINEAYAAKMALRLPFYELSLPVARPSLEEVLADIPDKSFHPRVTIQYRMQQKELDPFDEYSSAEDLVFQHVNLGLQEGFAAPEAPSLFTADGIGYYKIMLEIMNCVSDTMNPSKANTLLKTMEVFGNNGQEIVNRFWDYLTQEKPSLYWNIKKIFRPPDPSQMTLDI